MYGTEHVQCRVLPNGLTLLVERRPTAPVVAVVTHVRAGYFDEPDEWSGIAHVLEHMFFKGTARRGPGDVARETQLVGGYINAGTIYDRTVYYTVLPAAGGGLPKALDIQADALMHAALDPDELTRELEVIIQEAKRKLDTPSAVATETLYALLFRRHRIRRWRIGTEEGLRRLGAADVVAYYRTRYTPSRTIVALVGDLDADGALELASRTFDAWARPAAPVPGSPAETNDRHAAVRALSGDVERPLAAVGWRTVPTLHPDAPGLDVAAEILAAGRGSRLYRGLRLPGLAALAVAEHYTPTEVGVFEVDVEADADRFDRAVETAATLVGSLVRTPPDGAELGRIRALAVTRRARRMESMDGRASALCEAEALGGYVLVDELFARAQGVDADTVRDVAERYLAADAMCGVLYTPNGLSTWHERTWPPSGADATAAATGPVPMRAPARTAPVTVASRTEHRYPEDVTHQTYAGVDVVAWRKPESEIVTVRLDFPGPQAPTGIETAGVSWLLARAALRGAAGASAAELAEWAESLGGAVGGSVSVDAMGWGITVRRDALAGAIELLSAIAMEPTLNSDDVAREVELQASDARRVRDDMLQHPLQSVLRQAFPQDPYGLPLLGEPERVAVIDADAVRAWHRVVVERRPVVVVSGDFAWDAFNAAAAPLAAWPARSSVAAALAPTWLPGDGAETREKEQTAIALAFPAAPASSPRRHATRVLCSVLSGLAGRLFHELRERRSLAYTVTAIPWLAQRAGAVVCYVATSPDREAEARSAMLAELARVVAEPPDADEMDRARNATAGALEMRKQHGAAVARELLDALVTGTLEELAAAPEAVRGVVVDAVVAEAEAAFQRSARAEYVVRRGGTGR